jgi:hypothetical protein
MPRAYYIRPHPNKARTKAKVHNIPNPLKRHIYKYDKFDGIEGLGCEKPSCVGMVAFRQPLRVPGLLFADDTVDLALSFENLHAMFAPFSQRANVLYLEFGVDKYGVMTLSCHSNAVVLREQVAHWHLGEERVPIVFGYKKLGELMNLDSSMRSNVGDIWLKKVGAASKRSSPN